MKKQTKKKVGSILHSHTSEGNNSGTWELFEFPLMCTLPHPPPRLCLARNDTHFREGWPGEGFSPRPAAERRSVTLEVNESQHRAPNGAGHIPSLNPQKHALLGPLLGGHPANVKSPSCAHYISNVSDPTQQPSWTSTSLPVL